MKIINYFIYFFIIKGNIINQTSGEIQKNIKIYVFSFSQNEINLIDSLFSKDGKFKFEIPEGIYILKTIYKKVIFRKIFSFNKDTFINFPVWEIKDENKNVEISRIHIAMIKNEEKISCIEVINFENKDSYAFFKPFEIELPENFENFFPFSGIFLNEINIFNNRLLFHFPISPPEEILSFQYEIKGNFLYKRKFPFKIRIFELFSSPDLKIEGIGEGKIYEIGNKKYLRFKIEDIKEGEEIIFKVSFKTKILNFKEIFPIFVVLSFIILFLIFRWKKK
jgi:hypothetical protein